MCVDAPNDLPAGKYTTAVTLEGPPSTEPAGDDGDLER
jgi:hypothetical protein